MMDKLRTYLMQVNKIENDSRNLYIIPHLWIISNLMPIPISIKILIVISGLLEGGTVDSEQVVQIS
jgi:hypothetical protein